MSLVWEDTLAGSSSAATANFDSDVGSVTYASDVMTMDLITGGGDAYAILDSANGYEAVGTEQKAIHFKSVFKLADATLGSAKYVFLLNLRKGSTSAVLLQVRANGSNEANQIRIQVDNYAGSPDNTTASAAVTIADDTYYEIEMEWRYQSQEHLSDGIMKVWFGTPGSTSLIIDVTNYQFGADSSYFDELRVGKSSSTVATNIVMTISDVQLANNRTFTSGTETLYVDNMLGAFGNLGTSGSPFSSVETACSLAGAGDTVILVNNGVTNPYRSCRGAGDGFFKPEHSGTSGNLIEFKSDTSKAYVTNTIDATHGSGSYQWVESSTTGEWYLTIDGTDDPLIPEYPNFIAKSVTWSTDGLNGLEFLNNDGRHDGSANAATLQHLTRSPATSPLSTQTWTADEWIGSYIRNVTDGSTGEITDNDATTITATLGGGSENDWDYHDQYHIGVAGHLLAGQWDYADNDTLGFSTIYYKPTVSEDDPDQGTTHFEIPFGTYGSNEDSCIANYSNYTYIHDFIVWMAKGHGVHLEGGTGSTLEAIEANYCWNRGLYDISATTIQDYKCGNSLWFNEGGGAFIGNGATGTKQQMYCYNMQDDCFEIGNTAAGTTNVTIVGCTAYNGGISSTDGAGFEMGNSDLTGVTINLYNCLANVCDKGFSLAITTNPGTFNGASLAAINNRSYGMHDQSDANTRTWTNLGGYGNGSANFQSITDAGTSVITDPKIVFNTTNGTYRLRADSAWRGAGVDGAVTGNYGVDGNVFPSTNVDIGAMQAGGAVTTSGKVYIANIIGI